MAASSGGAKPPRRPARALTFPCGLTLEAWIRLLAAESPHLRDRSHAAPGDAGTTMPRAALCLVVLVAALASGGAAPAATSGVNGHLLVASGQRHQMALFAMQPRGGDRLLLNYGTDQGAAYSPDGTKIAFMNDYDGDYEICVMNADGTGIKQLTRNSAVDGFPTWS